MSDAGHPLHAELPLGPGHAEAPSVGPLPSGPAPAEPGPLSDQPAPTTGHDSIPAAAPPQAHAVPGEPAVPSEPGLLGLLGAPHALPGSDEAPALTNIEPSDAEVTARVDPLFSDPGNPGSVSGGIEETAQPVLPNAQSQLAAELAHPASTHAPAGGPTALGSVPALPDIGPEAGSAWAVWGRRLRQAQQTLARTLTGARPSVDKELEGEVQNLRDMQATFRRLLGQTNTLAYHLFEIAETHKLLREEFTHLAIDEAALTADYAAAAKGQEILWKNGLSLVGAINFFSDNIATLAFKSIDDTLGTWDAYYEAAAEADAPQTLEPARSAARQRVADLKAALEVKLRLLDEHKIKVLRKQLALFHSAMCAFFAGNQANLAEALAALPFSR
eukprot:m.221210 g.221210  ORF g.221210 m.221210 type:complete len:388 (+) comp10539_c0_seq1:25-1188(+)